MDIVVTLVLFIQFVLGLIAGFSFNSIFLRWLQKRRRNKVSVHYAEVDTKAMDMFWKDIFDGKQDEEETVILSDVFKDECALCKQPIRYDEACSLVVKDKYIHEKCASSPELSEPICMECKEPMTPPYARAKDGLRHIECSIVVS